MAVVSLDPNLIQRKQNYKIGGKGAPLILPTKPWLIFHLPLFSVQHSESSGSNIKNSLCPQISLIKIDNPHFEPQT